MENIRIAQPVDDEHIGQLLIKTFSNLYAAMGVTMSTQREAYLKDQIGRRAFATTFVYEVDAKLRGTVTLVPPSPDSEAWKAGAWDLRLLAVDPDMQGKGIARKLLQFSEKVAGSAGGTAICLHARKGVESQAALYMACNYIRDRSGDLSTEPAQEGYRKDL